MNGTHQDTPHDTSRYIKIHQDTYRIGNYTKSYRKLHVTRQARGACVRGCRSWPIPRSFLSGARGVLQVRVGRTRAREDVGRPWAQCAGRGAVPVPLLYRRAFIKSLSGTPGATSCGSVSAISKIPTGFEACEYFYASTRERKFWPVSGRHFLTVQTSVGRQRRRRDRHRR